MIFWALLGVLPPVRKCADASELAEWFAAFSLALRVQRMRRPLTATERDAERGRTLAFVRR